MARPRQFDRNEVLGKVTELFWEHGFDGASIQELVECTGVGRASLYGTFGSKDGLILEAMDCYLAFIRKQILSALERPGPAPDIIRDLFEGIIQRGGFGDNVKACLVTKAALMKRDHNEELVARACAFMDLVEDAFYRVLIRGRTEGHISPGKDPRSLARYFVTTLQGASVIACTRPKALAESLYVALWVLD